MNVPPLIVAMDDHLSIVGPTVVSVGENITFSVTGTDQVKFMHIIYWQVKFYLCIYNDSI